MTLALARHEWRRFSRTPLLWLVLAGSLFLLAYLFLGFLEHFTTSIAPQNTASNRPIGVNRAVITPTFLWSGILGMVLLPMFAARLFPEERQKRSWTLLATSPLAAHQIVFGKFLGLLLPISLISALPLLLSLTLSLGTALDAGLLLSATAGVWLCLTMLGSAIVYLSSLNRDPLTATLMAYGFLLLLTVFHFVGGQSLDNSLYELSPLKHLSPLLEARINSRDLLYFAGGITLFLWLAVRQVQTPRFRSQA